MPDMRSLEERLAEIVRDEIESEALKVCCQDFEHCHTPCNVRADHWKEAAIKIATGPTKTATKELRVALVVAVIGLIAAIAAGVLSVATVWVKL
jgi:hypothetical protein